MVGSPVVVVVGNNSSGCGGEAGAGRATHLLCLRRTEDRHLRDPFEVELQFPVSSSRLLQRLQAQHSTYARALHSRRGKEREKERRMDEPPNNSKRVSRSAPRQDRQRRSAARGEDSIGPNFRTVAGREFDWMTGGRIRRERAAKTREPFEARVFWCGRG